MNPARQDVKESVVSRPLRSRGEREDLGGQMLKLPPELRRVAECLGSRDLEFEDQQGQCDGKDTVAEVSSRALACASAMGSWLSRGT